MQRAQHWLLLLLRIRGSRDAGVGEGEVHRRGEEVRLEGGGGEEEGPVRPRERQ